MKLAMILAASAALPVVRSSENTQFFPNNNETQAIRDFVPLSCNAKGFNPCQPWSTVFGRRINQNNRLYIPCGECVVLDIPTVHLKKGIDVQGKWLVESSMNVNITTTGIFVQGVWEVGVTEDDVGSAPPVSDVPRVLVTLVGEDDQEFTPILENADACGGGKDCNIGMKGIVVAGGTIDSKLETLIRRSVYLCSLCLLSPHTVTGLADNAPTWLPLYDVMGPRKNPNRIIVDKSIVGHWGVGADILITSHTWQWDDHQERTILAIEPTEGDNEHVTIWLNEPISRPTTMTDDPDFAVEVALLSRNILFQGGPDSIPHRGGHLWVMNTPGVRQRLVGVEVRNFGQQGYLGRYPIHLHFCGDSGQTVIAKNTIRHSNQRCVVVHGTNQLQIRENIAYDTKGHCFMLEDGMEVDNQFMYNLGAQTGIPNIVIPNQGPNGDETDGEPSTFWITNPSNKFVGNVAAGSESSGFWFELLVRGERAHLYPDLEPKIAPLGSFRDNTVHSCLGVGSCCCFKIIMPKTHPPFSIIRKHCEHTLRVMFLMKKQSS